jgi:hypothetical protein
LVNEIILYYDAWSKKHERNILLRLTFIYCHLLNTSTNCREQTVALYRRLTVCVRRSNYMLTCRCSTFYVQNFTQRTRRLQSHVHPPCIQAHITCVLHQIRYSTQLFTEQLLKLKSHVYSSGTKIRNASLTFGRTL